MAYCQEHVFVVLNVKGNVIVNNGTKKAAAKIGLGLAGNEHIIVPEKSEITLVCKSEGYVLLNKPGTYNVADYNGKCQTSKTNLLSKYLQFAWEEFSHGEESNQADHQDKMQNVGAAVRGRSKCYAILDSSLSIVNYYQGTFDLCWQKNIDLPLRFKVYEYPDGGKPIIDTPITSNKYSLQKLSATLKKGVNYFWTLVPAGKQDECQRNHVEIWEKDDYMLLLKSFKDEAAAMTSDKANEAYMLGYLLDGTHFYAEALSYYNEALKLSPNNPLYSNTVKAFKKRYQPATVK